MAPLVRAAARLAEADLGAYAVVGGLAVSARLGRAHRATADVDTVVDDDLPRSAIEVLRNLPGSTTDDAWENRVYLSGIKVDLIATGGVTESDLEGLDDQQVLFVAGHRWALETAVPVTLTTDGGTRAIVPMARASALIAMKLGSIQDRRRGRGGGSQYDKRSTDAWDIYRLLTDLDISSTAAEIRSALGPLRTAVATVVSEVLIEHASRTRGWLRRGDAEMASVREDDLVGAGADLLARLGSG